MQEKPKDEAEGQEDTEVKEVEIVESDETPEPDPVETPVVEDVAPDPVEDARVQEILAESKLDEKAQAILASRTYLTEDDVQARVAEMQAFIASLAPPAGLPFAMGETAAVENQGVPKKLSADELAERAQQNTRDVIMGIDPTYAGNL